MLLQVSGRTERRGTANLPGGMNGGGCQVAEKDCRNLSLWVNLWVRTLRPERFLSFGMEHGNAVDMMPILVRTSAVVRSLRLG
jgi:hypothetical protein